MRDNAMTCIWGEKEWLVSRRDLWPSIEADWQQNILNSAEYLYIQSSPLRGTEKRGPLAIDFRQHLVVKWTKKNRLSWDMIWKINDPRISGFFCPVNHAN